MNITFKFRQRAKASDKRLLLKAWAHWNRSGMMTARWGHRSNWFRRIVSGVRYTFSRPITDSERRYMQLLAG